MGFHMKHCTLKSVILLLACIIQLSGQTHLPRHVLLIGIDGVSTEGFQFSTTPVLWELIRQGTLSMNTRCVMPSVSAPNWATILSGMGPEQHGVTSNEWSAINHSIEPIITDADGFIPTIFTAIRKAYPEAKTGMFHDWDWLGSFVNRRSISRLEFTKGHGSITAHASDFIKSEKPLFTFVYYGYPDGVAHRQGHGTREYFDAIREIDSDIGALVAALKESNMYEQTAILVVSDHGFLHKEHGGETMIEMEVPWLIAGPGIRRNVLLEQPNDAMNTTPIIARLLKIEPWSAWIGRAVDAAFEGRGDGPENRYVPRPSCTPGSAVTLAPVAYTLATPYPLSDIHYTLDGSDPTESSTKYSKPILVEESTELRAACFAEGAASRNIAVRNIRVKGIREITATKEPAEKYHGIGGTRSLVDGITGTTNFLDGNWLGYEGKDLEAEVEFDEVRKLSAISVRCLSENKSWIYLPGKVEFYTADDGKHFSLIGSGSSENSLTSDPQIVTYTAKFENLQARRIKVVVKNTGVCPPQRPGAGNPAWLFVDEVVFR
jgi:hypothetical protein